MFKNCRVKQKPMFMIIPMIDIIFFLLVFFMMSGDGMGSKSLPVQLPSAQHASDTYRKPVRIVLEKDGTLLLNDQKVSRDEALETMKKLTQENTNLAVIIEADKDSAHGQVVDVMELLKVAGVKRLAVAAQ